MVLSFMSCCTMNTKGYISSSKHIHFTNESTIILLERKISPRIKLMMPLVVITTRCWRYYITIQVLTEKNDVQTTELQKNKSYKLAKKSRKVVRSLSSSSHVHGREKGFIVSGTNLHGDCTGLTSLTHHSFIGN